MTLIEVMVVIAIIGLMMGAIGFKLFHEHRKAQVRTTESDILTVKQAVTSYGIDHPDQCPPSLDDLAKDGVLEGPPIDIWGMPFRMTCPAEKDRGVADVWSTGPDRRDGTDDDICSWKIARRAVVRDGRGGH